MGDPVAIAGSLEKCFTIMDLDTVRVYTNVPQDDSPWVVPGKTRATMDVKGVDRRSFTGTVTRSTLALDPSTRSLLVEIDLPNPDHALRPGTFVEVSLGLREIPNALVLPPQAVNSSAQDTESIRGTKIFFSIYFSLKFSQDLSQTKPSTKVWESSGIIHEIQRLV